MLKSFKSKPLPLLSLILGLFTILSLAVTAPLLGCAKDLDRMAADEGWASVALIWEDKFDSTDQITVVNLWIYDKSGELAVKKSFNGPNEVVLEKFSLKGGNHNCVIAVNLSEEINDVDESDIESLKHELARQCSLYEDAYYGDKTFEVVVGESRGVYVPFHDKPATNCERCDALLSEFDDGVHNHACGTHQCVEKTTVAEHIAADCGITGHFICDEKTHKKDDCGHYKCADGYTSTAHAKSECGHFKCADNYSKSNHTKADCGHFNCDGKSHAAAVCKANGHYVCSDDYSNEAHAKSECGHFKCADNYSKSNHTKADCGHFNCDGNAHTAAECKTSGHYVCSGTHKKRECGKHYTCDTTQKTMFCGHCECLLDGSNESYIHERYYCGHILCNETMEPTHKECEYCGSCLSYGTHSPDGESDCLLG